VSLNHPKSLVYAYPLQASLAMPRLSLLVSCYQELLHCNHSLYPNHLRNAFNDIKLNEYDDVRVVLVKLALDGHFHAVRYYLDNAGCFNGFGSKADYSDGKDEEEIIILNSMTISLKY
jgi:hypothetical protein